jgi:hypothetical protein
MAEAFVKIIERNYVRISPLSDILAALSRVDHWTGLSPDGQLELYTPWVSEGSTSPREVH